MPKVGPDNPEDYGFEGAASYLASVADPRMVTALTDTLPARRDCAQERLSRLHSRRPYAQVTAVNYRKIIVEALVRLLIWNCHVPNLH